LIIGGDSLKLESRGGAPRETGLIMYKLNADCKPVKRRGRVLLRCQCYAKFTVDSESAEYIVRFLRHRKFRKQIQRMGKVIRLSPKQLSYREVNSQKERHLDW